MDNPELKLATWNIHMGVGRDGRRDLAQTAQVIGELAADIVGLQEVDNRIHSRGSDLERLQDLTGMAIVAGPTLRRPEGDYGNALLTRLPVLEIKRHDISVRQREPRGLLIVDLNWQEERIRVAVTHLGLGFRERRIQIRLLIDCLSQGDKTALILMGDFNEWLFLGGPMRWLHGRFGASVSPATFPSRWPLLRLDHILSDPPERLTAKKSHKSPLAVAASDHLPLTADYRGPGSSATPTNPDT